VAGVDEVAPGVGGVDAGRPLEVPLRLLPRGGLGGPARVVRDPGGRRARDDVADRVADVAAAAQPVDRAAHVGDVQHPRGRIGLVADDDLARDGCADVRGRRGGRDREGRGKQRGVEDQATDGGHGGGRRNARDGRKFLHDDASDGERVR
jgi:hypothetical protein